MVKKVEKILYMGCYGHQSNRNATFIKGLKRNNINIYEYNVNSHNVLKNIVLFLRNFKRLRNQKVDLILFHSEAFIQFYIAKILASIKNVPLVHDIFISKLQTIYDDRKQFKKRIPKFLLRIILFTIDLIECSFSDYIILDTYSHIKYFHEKFNTSLNKFKRVLVGSQDNIFYPVDKNLSKRDKIIVGFVGTYIPLQGVKYIIEAAKILENNDHINFHLIGTGQTYAENRNLAEKLKLTNIKFMESVPLKRLPDLISKFDIGLGIFGNTAKALQVIPTKIFDGIAMKIPMISMESPAIRELFTNNENIILCKKTDPESLAHSILNLKNDLDLREKIRENAYELFNKNCSIDAIGRILLKILNRILLKN